MEPNSIAYLQYFTWSIDQPQADAATDMESLAAATATDVNMDSLTAAASANLTVADICNAVGCAETATLEYCDKEGYQTNCEDTIQAFDDSDYNVLTLPDNGGEWLVSSGDSEWSTLTLNLGDLEIGGSLNCEPNQFVTVKDHKMICVTPSTLTVIQEVPMWTVSNILIVAIIAALVFKVMPQLTLYNFFRAVWNLVIRPFKRKEKEITATWKDAKNCTRR